MFFDNIAFVGKGKNDKVHDNTAKFIIFTSNAKSFKKKYTRIYGIVLFPPGLVILSI